MSIDAQKYIRKPLYVDAVRVTNANFNEIAAWCQGEILRDDEVLRDAEGQGTGKPYIKVRVHNPINPRQMKAFVGDWLLYTERGYKVYTNKAFHTAFDLVRVESEPAEIVPANGEVTTNGAEAPKYPETELVQATPHSIAQAARENEAVAQEQQA
jgi:hypothetical protein